MSGWSSMVVWALALIAITITFLNPGGLIVGLAIALILLGVYYGVPYLGGIIRERQSGASAAKIDSGARRRIRGGRKK